MGEVQCDILTGNEVCCVFVRYIDTTHEKIKSFKAPDRFDNGHNLNVTQIMFYRGTLPTFPSELGQFFPNLKCIDIYDCGLKQISKFDLKDLPKLERLKIESNKLTFLPGDLFEFSPKISQVSFANNKISKIGEKLLDGCRENLISADFRGNSTLDVRYHKDVNNLSDIFEIIMDNCKPLNSLQELATKVIKNNLNRQNVAYINLIASIYGIDELMTSVEDFLDKKECEKCCKNRN